MIKTRVGEPAWAANLQRCFRFAPRAAALWMTCLALAGCLREDEISALALSPDGSVAAVVTARRGLGLVDASTQQLTPLVHEGVADGPITWARDGKSIAFSLEGPPQQVALAGLDGSLTTFPRTLARVWNPLPMPGGELLALSSDAGHAELARLTTASVTRVGKPTATPMFSPIADDSGRIAWVEFRDLRPVLMLRDADSTHGREVLRLPHPLDVEPRSIAFSAQGDGIAFVTSVGSSKPKLRVVSLKSKRGGHVRDVATVPQGTCRVVPLPRGGTICSGGEMAVRVDAAAGAAVPLRAEALPVDHISACGDGLWGVAADQLLVRFDKPGGSPRWVLPAFDTTLVLAEELFRAGEREASARVYEKAREGVRGVQDPNLLELLHLANVARTGRPGAAAVMLQNMIEEHRLPVQVPEADVWKLLGMTRLIAGAPRTATLAALGRYEALADAAYAAEGGRAPRDDMAMNALAILRAGDGEVARLYVRALGARLSGDLRGTIDAYTALLRQQPDMEAVQAEYLRALGNVEREIFRLGPSEAPFDVPVPTRIAYLELFERLCPNSQAAGEVSANLLQMQLETGRFAVARHRVRGEIEGERTRETLSHLSGLLETYLVSPEGSPYLAQAVDSVMLEPTIYRGALEHLDDAAERLVWLQAAAKHNLLTGHVAHAESLLRDVDEASTAPGIEAGSVVLLLAMHARASELRGEFTTATAQLLAAAELLRKERVDEFPQFVELRFRAAMLDALSTAPDELRAVLAAERAGGDDLIGPTWEQERLRRGLDQLLSLRALSAPRCTDTTPTATLLSGIVLGKLGAAESARCAFMEVAQTTVPAAVQAKALMELAALDENEHDAWNAARRFESIGALQSNDGYLADWAAFNQARLFLLLGHQTDVATATLTRLASQRSGAPLAVEAQELLDAGHGAQHD